MPPRLTALRHTLQVCVLLDKTPLARASPLTQQGRCPCTPPRTTALWNPAILCLFIVRNLYFSGIIPYEIEYVNITSLITTEYVKCLIKCHRKMLRNCASKWFNPLYCVFHNYHKYNHIHLSLCDIKANTKKIDVTYHHDSIGIFMQSVTFSHINYTLRL